MDTTLNGAEMRPLENLLSCFFESSEKEFRFLEQENGFACLSGLTKYYKGRRIFMPPVKNALTAFAEAATLYEKENTTFEISYNGAYRALDFYVCYDHVHRFPFDEILKASRKSFFAHAPAESVLQGLQLEQAIQEMGRLARKNISLITAPDPKMLQKLLQTREKIMEQDIRARLNRDMEDAAELAARALAQKNYRRVVELFTPYEANLSFANQTKLDLARQNLISP